MIVQNDHEAYIGKSADCYIEDLHACFAYQLRIGCQVFGWNGFIIEEELKRVSQPDTVHLELVPDVHSNVPHRPHFKSINTMTAHVCS